MIKRESEDFKDYNVDEETLSDPDSEIEGYMCTQKEIEARTILWEEINKDYLIEQQLKAGNPKKERPVKEKKVKQAPASFTDTIQNSKKGD